MPTDPRGLREDAPLLDAWLHYLENPPTPFTIPGHKQRADLYQGIFVVSPEGKVLAAHGKFIDPAKKWSAEILDTLDAGLKKFGRVTARATAARATSTADNNANARRICPPTGEFNEKPDLDLRFQGRVPWRGSERNNKTAPQAPRFGGDATEDAARASAGITPSMSYAVSKDARRFLIVSPLDDRPEAPLTVIRNWSARTGK